MLVVSNYAMAEAFRNLGEKEATLAAQLAEILASIGIEVVSEADPAHIDGWSAAGLGTDAPIVAAAIEAEGDYLCTGDQGIHDMRHAIEAAGVKVIRPRDLLTLLEG